jgi:hypothetical protein
VMAPRIYSGGRMISPRNHFQFIQAIRGQT